MLLALWRFTLIGYLFRIRGRGSDFGPYRKRKDIRQQVGRRTNFNDFGYRVFVQRKRDSKVLSIWKIEVEDPIPDLGCAPDIEKAHAALVKRYGAAAIPSGGRYYCRYVDGSHIVSHHGYVGPGWKGGAEDIFSVPDNMDSLGDKAYFLVAETKAGRLNLNRVIVGNSSWSPSTGWEWYGGEYHRHVHYQTAAGSPCSP